MNLPEIHGLFFLEACVWGDIVKVIQSKKIEVTSRRSLGSYTVILGSFFSFSIGIQQFSIKKPWFEFM